MHTVITSMFLWVVLLATVMLLAMECGRYLRRVRSARRTGEAGSDRSANVEGAVFALFGLLVAFTFTGAASRYDVRRQLVTEETNAIGTAWLRLDVLPAESRPPLQDLMRKYLDERIAIYAAPSESRSSDDSEASLDAVPVAIREGLRLAGREAAGPHIRMAAERQKEIWQLATEAVARDGRPQTATLVLPPLNQMFDIASARMVMLTVHVPYLIVAMLIGQGILASLMVGYTDPPEQKRNWFWRLVFIVAVTGALYVILDLEFPRVGFVRLDRADWPLIELRQSMGSVTGK